MPPARTQHLPRRGCQTHLRPCVRKDPGECYQHSRGVADPERAGSTWRSLRPPEGVIPSGALSAGKPSGPFGPTRSTVRSAAPIAPERLRGLGSPVLHARAATAVLGWTTATATLGSALSVLADDGSCGKGPAENVMALSVTAKPVGHSSMPGPGGNGSARHAAVGSTSAASNSEKLGTSPVPSAGRSAGQRTHAGLPAAHPAGSTSSLIPSIGTPRGCASSVVSTSPRLLAALVSVRGPAAVPQASGASAQ